MADFTLLHPPRLISRKIWVIEKFYNFHTVQDKLSTQSATDQKMLIFQECGIMLQFTKLITIPILKNPTKSNSMQESSKEWKNRWVKSRNFTIFLKNYVKSFFFSQAFSKKVRSKYIAYNEPAKVRLQVGTRIVGK